MHIQRHTHTSTHVHMYNQHTRGMATTRHRPGSLVDRGRRRLRPGIQKKKCQEKPIFTNLKKRFLHIELPAKLLDFSFELIKATSINRKIKGKYVNANHR